MRCSMCRCIWRGGEGGVRGCVAGVLFLLGMKISCTYVG